MKKPKNTEFKGGLVNSEVLEDLQQSFNTMEILDAVDLIDEIRASICEPEEMRFDLLRLHGQSHALINGDYTNASGKEGYAIWELADELESEIGEWANNLRKISEMLDKLVMLAPEEEYDDDE